MFENDLTLYGRHATYVKFFVNEAMLYDRYIDVYMNGAVFGLLHGRTSPRDKESTDRARIYADAFSTCRTECVLLYRLVMLLDETKGLDDRARINRAFRDDADEKGQSKLDANMELFNSYARGGIDEMYEQFIDGRGAAPEEYLERAVEVMASFKAELAGEGFEDKLAKIV